MHWWFMNLIIFFFQAEDGIRDDLVTGVQTCALPISYRPARRFSVRFAGAAPPRREPRLSRALRDRPLRRETARAPRPLPRGDGRPRAGREGRGGAGQADGRAGPADPASPPVPGRRRPAP